MKNVRGVMKILKRVLVLVFFLPALAIAQPLVIHYSKDVYGGGNQNWSIAQDKQGLMYVGNNDGLLQFDGTNWKLYPLPDRSIVRSVAVGPDGKIYTGAFEEFGYWQPDKTGQLKYTSISHSYPNLKLHNWEFWRILFSHDKAYFQSFGALFSFDGDTVRKIPLPSNVILMSQVGNRLITQEDGGGLMELINDQPVHIPGSDFLSSTQVKSIIPGGKDTLLVCTSSRGIYQLASGKFSLWGGDIQEFSKHNELNVAIPLKNGYAFGTILNGVVITGRKGNIKTRINTESGLQNNTILALKEDKKGGLWVAMNKGIDYVEINSPLSVYRDKDQRIGALTSAVLFEGKLFVGSNRGVYYRNLVDGDPRQPLGNFQFLDGTQGQVWDLQVHSGSLIIGHNRGTFTYKNGRLRQISNVSGGYMVKPYERGGNKYMIQSTYTRLAIYRLVNGSWQFDHQVTGFNEPCRFVEIGPFGYVWVSHQQKGVYRLKLDANYQKVLDTRYFGRVSGLPGDFNVHVFKVSNRIVLTSPEGLYTYDDLHEKVVPMDDLNRQLGELSSAHRIIHVGDNRYWLISRDMLGLVDIRDSGAMLIRKMNPDLYGFSMVERYENIVPLNKHIQMVCLDEGYALVDLNNKVNDTSGQQLFFRDAIVSDSKGKSRRLTISPVGSPAIIQLQPWERNIKFRFASLRYTPDGESYQYYLKGLKPDEHWKSTFPEGEAAYERLAAGSYVFHVRNVDAFVHTISEISYPFIIRPYWYASSMAYFFYVIIGILIIIISQLVLYRRFKRREERVRHERQIGLERRREEEREHAENEIIKLRNEKLQAELSHKDVELANSTMSIIRKNESLIEIKNEIERQKKQLGTRYPRNMYEKLVGLVDKNLTNEDDWLVFESHFDQAHENFFRRLKSEYPVLTPSDLKLCAYLRLNLATKEIAPLLNISVRGVEIRRYRLRKKLELPQEKNLVEFMIEF
jgi:ligand-binding sensor domain-containing protein/DNA-binding CsgD family transcriptional regulator